MSYLLTVLLTLFVVAYIAGARWSWKKMNLTTLDLKSRIKMALWWPWLWYALKFPGKP